MTEPVTRPTLEEPLTEEEQAKIDAAWRFHRSGHTTLLDAFGEASEKVVALRAEVSALAAENQKLREALKQLLDRIDDWVGELSPELFAAYGVAVELLSEPTP